jgi:hypothetical protein
MAAQATSKGPRKKMPTVQAPSASGNDDLRAQLNTLMEELGAQRAEIERLRSLEEKIVPGASSPEVKKPVEKLSLRDRVREILLEKSMDFASLAKATKVRDRTDLRNLINELEKEELIYNYRSKENPRWTWRVGPNADAQVLHRQVVKLLKEVPMEREDLIRATGATEKQIDGRLVEIRRSATYDIKNLAPDKVSGLYFIFGTHVQDAHLAPKRSPKLGTVITHGRRREDEG